jgi:hypothetical protein
MGRRSYTADKGIRDNPGLLQNICCPTEIKSRNMIVGRYTLVQVKKGKVVSVLTKLSTTPRRRVEEWRYSYTILDLGTRWR